MKKLLTFVLGLAAAAMVLLPLQAMAQNKSRLTQILERGTLRVGTTGDFNPMHFDAEYMKTHQMGQRIAHGMLSLSYAVGQAYQLGFMERTVLAFRGLEMKFSLPVFIGDTMHVLLTVKEKTAMPRLGGGTVILDVKIVNQAGKTIQSGTWTVLIASKPKGD